MPDFITLEIAFKKISLSSDNFLSLLINLNSSFSLPIFQYEWNSDASSYKYTGILWGSNLFDETSMHFGHSEIFFKILISSDEYVKLKLLIFGLSWIFIFTCLNTEEIRA